MMAMLGFQERVNSANRGRVLICSFGYQWTSLGRGMAIRRKKRGIVRTT
jgi:hypothetical protein